MAIEAQKATDKLKKEGIDVEFIDIRTLKPLDENIIINSVKKTGRLIIVDGAWRTGSFSGEIAAIIAEKAFSYLKGTNTKELPYLDVPVLPVLNWKSVLPSIKIIFNPFTISWTLLHFT